MTPTQRSLVQDSWKQVVPVADEAAKLFYRRLFEADPSAALLFRGSDMAAQRNKLLQVLTIAISGLDNLEKLLPVVRDLGRRHAGYGVADSHYDSVGAALLWTLEERLGSSWTADVAEAWARTYALLAEEMIAASHAVEA